MAHKNKIRLLLVVLSLLFVETQAQDRSKIQILQCSPSIKEQVWQVPQGLQSPLNKPIPPKGLPIHEDNLFLFHLHWDGDFRCPKGKLESHDLRYENNYTNPAHKESLPHQLVLNTYYWSQEATLKVGRAEAGEVKGDFFPPQSYCLEKILKNELVTVRVCVPDCQKPGNCIPKCSAPSQAISLDLQNPSDGIKYKSVKMDPEWKLTLRTEAESQKYKPLLPPHPKHVRYAPPHCQGNVISTVWTPSPRADISIRSQIQILDNGKIMTRKHPYGRNHLWMEFDQSLTFCVDRFWELPMFEGYELSDTNMSIVLLFCQPIVDPGVASHIYFAIYIIASPFSFLTVLVYGLLWDKQNLHGWTVATFSGCMCLHHVLSAVAIGNGLSQEPSTAKDVVPFCVAIGVLIHFFYVGLFSWLSVLSFDLWSTVSSMTPTSLRSKGWNKYLTYCCFGFGIPALVVTISLGIEICLRDSEDVLVYRPLYGYSRCALDTTSFVYYTTIPNILLYTFNLVFVIQVAITFWRHKKETEAITKSNENKHFRTQAILYLKLFVLMGITWIFEFNPYFNLDGSTTNFRWYWFVFDVCNIFQSVGIFWIFVCKEEIRDQLSLKYSVFKSIFSWMNNSLTTLVGRKTSGGTVSIDTRSPDVVTIVGQGTRVAAAEI